MNDLPTMPQGDPSQNEVLQKPQETSYAESNALPMVADSVGSPPSPIRGPRYRVLYSQDLGDLISDLFSEGQTLQQIAKISGMPAYGTILNWVKTNESFRNALKGASAVRALHFEGEAIQAAIDTIDKDDAPAARVKTDTFWRAAEVNDPTRYGKKTTISGDPDKPLTFVITTKVPDSPYQVQAEIGADGIQKVITHDPVEPGSSYE